MMAVPASFKRPGVKPRAFFLWDNTAYAFGITASETKGGLTRLDAFRTRHERELAGTNDEGLQALLRFIEAWTPEDFVRLAWPSEMKDQNVVFALESERRRNVRIHDRPAARELWANLSAGADKLEAACLVTGEVGPVARLHSTIKGVWDAQTSGASIVSFNHDAFASYGHEQGENAPVSEAAAFAYATALNHFLEKGSGHRIQIGDATTVFWAEAEDAATAAEAEDAFAGFFALNEKDETEKVAGTLKAILDGLLMEDIKPSPSRGVRFFVLALAPNAARLSVRFYIDDDFGVIAKRYAKHVQMMRIEAPTREAIAPMWRLLIETATLRKSENIVPNLAGEWMRAILTGARYPVTLLSTVLRRLRADHDVNAVRVAIIKSVLIRNFGNSFRREPPVSLDPENKEPGYLLGRLFAVYEQIQTAALGSKVNATIKDKFYGTAASQPQKVFPLLDKGSKSHLSKLGKDRKGYQVVLERKVAEIMEVMSPGEDPFPLHLPDKQQGLFALGYYHQHSYFYSKSNSRTEKPVIEEPAA
jgi:CRISPR-associated protein Csd1